MQTHIIDALRVKYGSDSAAAQALGVTRQAVNLWRRGSNCADDATVTRACILLDLAPATHLATHRAACTDDPQTRAVWLDIARSLTLPDQQPAPEHPANALNIICGNTNYTKQTPQETPAPDFNFRQFDDCTLRRQSSGFRRSRNHRCQFC